MGTPSTYQRRRAVALAVKLTELREERGLSGSDIGKRCNPPLSRNTIWKFERGCMPKAPTLRNLAINGLGIKENSEDFRNLVALWTEVRLESGMGATFDEMRESARSGIEREMAPLVRAWKQMRPHEMAALRAAMEKPELMAVLVAAHAFNGGFTKTRVGSKARAGKSEPERQ